jgi:hypothetical protein
MSAVIYDRVGHELGMLASHVSCEIIWCREANFADAALDLATVWLRMAQMMLAVAGVSFRSP